MTTEKIEVVAPLRVSERKIHDFVKLQHDWVVAARDKVEKSRQTVKEIAPEVYKEGVQVPFQGETKRIQLKFVASKKIKITCEQQVFTIELATDRLKENNHALIRLALIDWMKNQAVKEMASIIDEYAEKYNLYPRRIRVKSQKSRWGSCGIHNDINLNWLLILTPPKVMEYVVIHELCHIQERNHSSDFWALVEKYCPDYKEHRLWLKQNGRSVMQGL